MILWTIQSTDAWTLLRRSGTLRCDRRFADAQHIAAYQWMAQQMLRRLKICPPNGAIPLWAWYQWEGDRRRPADLRRGGYLPAGERGVRIKFEIDDDLVLLSDFELWHYVLNYWYLATSLADGEAVETRLAEHGLSIHKTRSRPDSVFDRIVKESWNRIFDLEWEQDGITHSAAQKSIQGSLWELTLDAVRQVDEFTAR